MAQRVAAVQADREFRENLSTQLTRRLAAKRRIYSDIHELQQFANRMLADIGLPTDRGVQFDGQIAAVNAQILSRASLLSIVAFRLCAAASICLATAGATAAESATVVSKICAAADRRLTTLIEAPKADSQAPFHPVSLRRYSRTLSRAWEVDMKVAVACQGGGMHAAFEAGVLTEILKDMRDKTRFELVGLSGTSSGALCTLMVWYGLAPKKGGGTGSVDEAISTLNNFWESFVASTSASTMLNLLTYGAFRAEEIEIPVLGVSARVFDLNPSSAFYKAVAACLPSLGVRKRYVDLDHLLDETCPEFDRIDWRNVKTRLLIGASEVVNGFETIFDSDVNKGTQDKEIYYWRQRLRLTLSGVAASGTLPIFREAEHIKGAGYYWDGLYSQNPPVREFLAGADEVPDELWIVRINPQQWPEVPKSNADIEDRQNELMGNLSLNKELDFILTVNKWRDDPRYSSRYGEFAKDHKHVTVRTIKMEEETADKLRYSSKFNRSRDFMDQMRKEGRVVARDWLDRWPEKAGCYPEDAAYRKFQTTGPKPRLPKTK